MANPTKALKRPSSGIAVDSKHTGFTGKETQPDNSKCMGVDNKCNGTAGVEDGGWRADYSGS